MRSARTSFSLVPSICARSLTTWSRRRAASSKSMLSLAAAISSSMLAMMRITSPRENSASVRFTSSAAPTASPSPSVMKPITSLMALRTVCGVMPCSSL